MEGTKQLKLSELIRLKWSKPEDRERWRAKYSAVRRAKLSCLSEAQNHRCCYCGTPTWMRDNTQPFSGKTPGLLGWQMATLEHVRPQAEGGTDSMWNLVMSCAGCNNDRGDMFEAQELFDLMKGGHTFWERRELLARALVRRKQKLAKLWQVHHNQMVVYAAWLFHRLPHVGEALAQAVEMERRAQQRQRALEENNRKRAKGKRVR